MSSRQSLVLIGLDSAPPQLVFGEWRERLPHLRALMEQGVWGELTSSHPPITVPAWACMMTGKNPGRLGFYGFRNRQPGTYDRTWIATASAVKEPTVWDLLSRANRRVCLVGMPQTYPVRPVNGAMVSCFLTPDTNAQYTYPAALKAEVEAVSEGYMLDVPDFRTEDKARLLSDIYALTDKQFRVARHLLAREPWDFFAVVTMGPDRIQHGFWKYGDPTHRKHVPGNPFATALADYYVRLDEEVGAMLELAPPDAAVIVVSDHGAKRMDGSLSINDWLIAQGWLVLKGRPAGPRRFDPALVDWSRTRAWAWGGYYSRVFLNVAGREPEGIIPRESYESAREELRQALLAVQDETGRRMDTRIHTPQELFSGPYVEAAPDLFVYFDNLYWRAGQDLGHEGIHSFDTEVGPDDAVHDQQGLFVMRGAGRSGGRELTGLEIRSVAPTVLQALEVPVPAEVEGTVIA